MPVIAFANSKGGSGKTTSALLLACELAESKPVTIVDADPRRPISSWVKLGAGPPGKLTIIASGGEETIFDEIEKAATRDPFVIIDLEGVASRLTSYAIGQCDFVIVPMKEQQQDAVAALGVIKEIHRDMKAVRRSIAHAVLFTQTRVVAKSRTSRHIAGQFRGNGQVDTFETEINDRDAFSAIFATGGSVRALDPGTVNNLGKAIGNVEAFTREVISKLKVAKATGRRVAA